jgi:phosphonate transport system substrate-binding protein
LLYRKLPKKPTTQPVTHQLDSPVQDFSRYPHLNASFTLLQVNHIKSSFIMPFEPPDRQYKFLIDSNLGLSASATAWPETFANLSIATEETNDLPYIGKRMLSHEPDFGFIPAGDYWRMRRAHFSSDRSNDFRYRGLAIPTSKFTGVPRLASVVVVKKDDPAQRVKDLKGAKFGYINKSCTACYFAGGVLLSKEGEQLENFWELKPTSPWQGQIDAVGEGQVRVTVVPEDVWVSEPRNAETTKVIGKWEDGVPAFVVVREDVDERACEALLKALVRWMPPWQNVYGAFKPFYLADVVRFFHELDGLPRDF